MIIFYRIDSYSKSLSWTEIIILPSRKTGARLHQHMVCKLAEDKLNEK